MSKEKNLNMVNITRIPPPSQDDSSKTSTSEFFKQKSTYIFIIFVVFLSSAFLSKAHETKLIQQEQLNQSQRTHKEIINHGFYSVGKNPVMYVKDNVLYKLISLDSDLIIVLQSQSSNDIFTINKK